MHALATAPPHASSGPPSASKLRAWLQVLEELSRGITNKLLHGPMQALRSDGTDAQSVSETLVSMHALERMFDLQNEIPIAREASSALDD